MGVQDFYAGKAGVMKARTFFETLCPMLLKLRQASCAAVGGVYAFDLTGTQGGRWTLNFTHGTVTPSLGPADLTLRMEATTFAAMIAGDLDVLPALASGRISITGDRRLFMNLSAFTDPLPNDRRVSAGS